MIAALRLALVAVVAALGSPALADCELGRAAGADGQQQVLTLAEAAEFLRVDQDFLGEAAAHGEVPGRVVAGEWRFFRGALTAWLAGSDRPSDCFDAADSAESANPPPRGVPAPAQASGTQLRTWELAATVGRNVAPPVPTQFEPGARPPGSADAPPGGMPPNPAPQGIDQDQSSFGEPSAGESAVDVALRREAVLTPKGAFSAELALFYARRDRDLSSLSPFGLTVANQKMQTFGASLIGRYGLRDDLEFNFGLPWIRRTEDVTVSRPDSTVTVAESSESTFENVRLGLQYAAVAEGPRLPGVVVAVDGLIPVDGSRAYSLGGAVSLVKSIDPAILFANVGYQHTFNADTLDVDQLLPEDNFVAVAGVAFAMNDRLSGSASVIGTFNPDTEFDDFTLESDQTFDLRFALTSLLREGLFIEPSVSIGLNGPDSRFAFGLSIPYLFDQ